MVGFLRTLAAAALLAGVGASGEAAAQQRVKLTGEVVDSWCEVSGIMFARGTAHHQCAVWCAVGGVPVGLLGDDDRMYILLKVENDGANVSNPTYVDMQTDKITVEADLYERDGVRYLVVQKVVANEGIVNKTHEQYGIQPFGD